MTTDPTPTISDADREELVDLVASTMRDLSVSIGVREFAVPLARGVDLAVAVDKHVAALIARERKSARDQALDEAAAAIDADAERWNTAWNLEPEWEASFVERREGVHRGRRGAARIVRALKST